LKRPATPNGSLINQAGRPVEPVSNRLAPVVLANGWKPLAYQKKSASNETLYLTDIEILEFRLFNRAYQLIFAI